MLTSLTLPPKFLKIHIGSVWIELIFAEIENWNWKHCSKIIFKCVNSAVRLNFKEKFVEIRNFESHEQCTEPTQKSADMQVLCFQCNPNILYTMKWSRVGLSVPVRFTLEWFIIYTVPVVWHTMAAHLQRLLRLVRYNELIWRRRSWSSWSWCDSHWK